MNKVYLSKSKFCSAKQCNKILWMEKNKPEEAENTARQSILENGIKVGELARGYFGEYINIEYNTDLSKMVLDTELALENKPNIITEASFNYDNNFCSVDILKNDIDGVEIYEVKSTTKIEDKHLDDVAYQYFVLNNLGYNIKKACLMILNKQYVRHGDLELNKLFEIIDLTDIAKSKQEEVKNKIEEINEFMERYSEEEPEIPIDMYCFEPYPCAFWKYCTRFLPKNNVFGIKKMELKKKLELYNQGKISFEDLKTEKLRPEFLEQIDFEINNKEPKIEVEKIKEFMNTLTYPLYFLDFESFQQAIPEFDGISPYQQQIPFQYSLHYIEKDGGELKHKEFLAESGEDPRRKLAERLVKDIPENVCVLAYNMGFEKSIIKKLAEIYEDLNSHLMNIHENIKDLMIPFRKKQYYAKELEGFYTIKYVLPTLFPDDPELDYHNLKHVHNGEEAPDTFLSLANKTKEEQEELRKALLEYCKLDTYAMVKIWGKLKEIIKDNNI